MSNTMIRRLNQSSPILKEFLGPQFDKAFSELMGEFPMTTQQAHPHINITKMYEAEGGNNYYIEYALAGYSREDIDISVEKASESGNEFNVLTVTAEKQNKVEPSTYITKEISTRKAQRKVILGLNDEVVGAEYVDGILTLQVFRKAEEKPKVTKIQIN